MDLVNQTIPIRSNYGWYYIQFIHMDPYKSNLKDRYLNMDACIIHYTGTHPNILNQIEQVCRNACHFIPSPRVIITGNINFTSMAEKMGMIYLDLNIQHQALKYLMSQFTGFNDISIIESSSKNLEDSSLKTGVVNG
jgi:hypothetical protein